MVISLKTIVLFAAITLIPVVSLAEDGLSQAIQERYRTVNDLTAEFTQSTYIQILDKTISEPGFFFMKRPGKLRIEYAGEQPKEYLSDGKTLWIYDKALGQLEKFRVSKDSIPKEGLELLKGFADMDEIFTIESWKPKGQTKGHTYLRLSPRSGQANYKFLDCDFGSDNLLNVMTIHNKSGNISTYTFRNIRVNGGINDALFKWRN